MSGSSSHRSKNAPVNGPILMQKSNAIAQGAEHNFNATEGWFYRWQKRHVSFAVLKGKSFNFYSLIRVIESLGP